MRREGLAIDGQQGHEVRPAIAHYARARDARPGLQRVLELLRGDVLAARRDDELFFSVGDVPEPVDVSLADVAGVKKSLGVQGLVRRRLVAPVALKHVGPAHEQLAVLGTLDRDAGQWLADAAEAERRRHVDGRGRRGLGRAPALADQDAHGVEEPGNVAGQGRPAADNHLQVPAEPLANGCEDQPVRDHVLHRQVQMHRLTGLDGPGVALADAERPVEHAPPVPGRGGHLGRHAGVDFLQHARHGHHEGGPNRLEVLAERVEAAGVGDGVAHVERKEVPRGALEDVRERQDAQVQIEPAEVADVRLDGGDGVDHIAVGQDGALGHARRAAGVDDREGRLVAAEHAGQTALAHRAAPLEVGQFQDVGVVQGAVEQHERGQLGHRAALGQQLFSHHRVARESDFRAGMPDDPGGLLGRQARVDAHRDAARRDDGQIRQGPFGAIVGHDGHAIARRHANPREALGHGPHAVHGLSVGDLAPGAGPVVPP
ncbi:hypothetical protein D3C72_569180 [compost metagenome]